MLVIKSINVTCSSIFQHLSKTLWAMENPHGSQAFFNGLKEDSFSKDDQWVEQVSMDSIDPTKIWVWINIY